MLKRIDKKFRETQGLSILETILFMTFIVFVVVCLIRWHYLENKQTVQIDDTYSNPTAGITYYMARLEYHCMQNAVPMEIEEMPVDTVKMQKKKTLPDLIKPVSVCDIPDGEGVCDSSARTYMDYRAVTSRRSKQYDVLNNGAYTDDATGIRMNDGRYCIAVGLGYGKAGDILDLVMEDDRILECIVGDVKAPQHCDPTNRYQKYDGSVVELIVDKTYYKKSPQFFNQHIQEIWKYE